MRLKIHTRDGFYFIEHNFQTMCFKELPLAIQSAQFIASRYVQTLMAVQHGCEVYQVARA